MRRNEGSNQHKASLVVANFIFFLRLKILYQLEYKKDVALGKELD